MSVSERIPVFALVFGVGYAVIYVVCTEVNLPLITYHPVTGDIGLLRQPAKTGPVMYWYGWMLTSLVGAVALAACASFLPEGWVQRTITFGCLLAAAYFTFYAVALFVYDRATVELEFLQSRSLSLVAAALTAAILMFITPRHWHNRLWYGWIWVVPAGAIGVLAYYLAPYFRQ